ncbi:MAG: amidohydrolase family protein [Gilvibacter sp.]
MKHLLTIIILFVGIQSVAQTFTLTNATIFTGEEVLENSSIVIVDGMITQVGVTVTSQGESIDCKGKFIMPALTNSHVHSFNPDNLKEAAQAGVLNLLDMHGVETMQAMMAVNNETSKNARYFYAGPAATAPNGHGTQYGFPTPTLTNPTEANDFVANRIKAGASYLKIIVEPWKPTLTHDIVTALINAAKAADMPVVVHVSRLADALEVQKNGASGLVHIWWDQQIKDQELINIASRKDFFVIPTILTSHLALATIRKSGGEYLSDDLISEQVLALYKAGVPILAGTDPPNANINYGTDLHKEMALLVAAGIPVIDALKAATSLPAVYFRLDKVGYLKQGFKADLLVLSESPMTNIANLNSIEQIYKKGISIKK